MFIVKPSILFAIAISASAIGCHTVEPGNVGVFKRFGTIDQTPRQPGLYGTTLGFANIEDMSTRTQSYTMAGPGQEAQSNGSVNVLSRDQLAVALDVTIQFHLNGQYAVQVYQKFGLGYADLIHQRVRTAVRDAASEFTAVDLVDKRQELAVRMNNLIRTSVREMLTSQGVPEQAVAVDNVMIRNIDLPNSLDEAIARVQTQRQATAQAEQAALTARQNAERMAVEATGNAEALRIRTEGEARAIRINAEANAAANTALARSLTPELVRYQQIEMMGRLLGSNQSRVILYNSSQPPMLMNMPTQ